MNDSILEIQNLSVRFLGEREKLTLVDDVSFSVSAGECLGILGESGSGKSMTCKAFMRLLDGSFEVEGQARFGDKELLSLSGEEMRSLRGKQICMILQNPMVCFDPLYRIGEQMGEGFAEHTSLRRAEIVSKSLQTLQLMRIKQPEEVMEKYPHQLSGGMLQRVMIGLALSMEPALIVADEPTTAIDSITQYEILKEFMRIKSECRTAMIFISHDLGVISQIADRVIVMHQARITQSGPVRDILTRPQDAYTRFLIDKKMVVMKKFMRVMKTQSEAVPERKTA